MAAIDMFGDCDLRDVCAMWFPLSAAGSLVDRLARLPAGPVMPLGGMESRTEELEALRASRPVLAPTAEQHRQLSDPTWLDRVAAESGICRPLRRQSKPVTAADWLYKKAASTGGLGVERASAFPESLASDGWFERQVPGRSWGVNFLTCGDRVDLLGVAASVRSRHPPKPFQYEGSIGLPTVSAPIRQRLLALGENIVRQTQLRGLFGIDVIIDRDRTVWLLEINPRWTASMELFDRGPQPLFQRHVDAWLDKDVPNQTADAMPIGKRVLYAARTLRFDGERLGDALPSAIRIADRPADGTEIPRGQPICSLLAQGACPRGLAYRLATACRILRRAAAGA
ncbi:ATP-grasp domain protein [Rosistilla carotiformis]|uniref:ATP-grasp domain protein n=1 Tax=Rosistilla carotiformis TaxID=2528017 RepID=A0A518JT28_9BACT|nr:ATP-grasp domain protein [Rosistilla carotiformis]